VSLVVATEPTSLVAVEDQCARIEAWAETCDNVAELRDAMNKCSAISEYLRLTATEGCARVEAAKRRLEVRVGALLGPPRTPAETGRGTQRRDSEIQIPEHQHSAFRAMAADPDEVEAVIAASTDQEPPSRRKVMDAIKSKRKTTEDDVLKKLSRAAVEARVAKATEMAEAGYTSRQIAESIGIDADGFTAFKKRHGVTVPADAIVGKTHRHDSDRMVSESVDSLEGVAMTLDLVGHPADAGLDPDQIAGWATSLTASLTALTRFNKQLKEMTQ
jgi:hypothetical protein